MEISDLNANICKINDITFEYDYVFKNPDGREKHITSSAIRELMIVDNVFNPFMRGSVSVANPYELFEDGFQLRGDGRDEFQVTLKTIIGGDGGSKTFSNNELSELSETFILLKEENMGDMNVRSENIKSFKLTLKDNLPFMDTIPHGRKYQGKIGDILRDIFTELLGKERVDADNWQSGDFEIEYYPPLSYRYIDLVYHLLKFFYGYDGDLHVKALILRDPKTKKYSMTFISDIFVKNSENVIDTFVCSDIYNTEPNGQNSNNPPESDKSSVKLYAGGIKNFVYDTPLYEWNNDFFINYVVHGYDPLLGVHNMRVLRVEDIEPKWISRFVNPFNALGGKVKPFLVKNNKTSRKIRHYRTPYTIEDNVKLVESEMYNLLTFYNLNSTFTNLGDMDRSSGKFVDIVKIGDEELDSDQKMFGRWFITEIKHIFAKDIYYNTFECCKTYVGPKNNIQNNVE